MDIREDYCQNLEDYKNNKLDSQDISTVIQALYSNKDLGYIGGSCRTSDFYELLAS